MSERSVWLYVLRDILEVIPLPRLRHALPSMLSSELRGKAAMITRLDALWGRDTIHPANIESYRLDLGVMAIEVIPGGDWVLKLFEDGSLHLHHRRDFAGPLATASRPNRPNWDFEGSAYMRRSFSSCGENWVVVKDHYVTPEEISYTDHRVYHIDISSPSVRLLTSVTRQSYCYDLQVKGDLLVIAEQDDSTYFLSVSKISIPASMIQEELVMNLGSELTSLCSINILCSHIILVSASFRMHLFEIPELKPAGGGGSSHAVWVKPLVANGHDKSIRNALCDHHDGCVSAYAFAEHQQALIILPSPGQSDNTTVRYVLQGSCYRNASRAIMCHDYVHLQPIKVQCFTHFTRFDGHAGYIRLGRDKALDPSRSVTIPLAGHIGRNEDSSWDEESGQVCIIYTPLGVSDHRIMVLVDLL